MLGDEITAKEQKVEERDRHESVKKTQRKDHEPKKQALGMPTCTFQSSPSPLSHMHRIGSTGSTVPVQRGLGEEPAQPFNLMILSVLPWDVLLDSTCVDT